MKKLHEIETDIIAHASKDNVWDLLVNRFGETNNFNPLIVASHALDNEKGEVGHERICAIDEKRSVRERISAIRQGKSFDIDIVEGGLPMMDQMKAKVSLNELEADKTRIVFQIHFNTKPAFMAPALKGTMKKEFGKVLLGLKYHLETGKLVSKSNIKEIMNDYNIQGNDTNFEFIKTEASLA